MPVGGGFTNCGCGPEATACENPTQPVATVGLCLADGRPIAVTVVMDCSGNVTSEGWIDLTTGAYSVGVPPAGTMACGDARSVEVSGVFCDVDQTSGDVLGLVLIEYQYAADGTVESVRLVDAVTGDTYTPQGEVTTCPAGVEQPEKDLVVLCDTTEDGTVVTFVRDYARDENGTITGFSDYGLDGAPYAPAGTVGVCQCPTSFTTECWEAVEAEARYNTTGGGDCGGISPSSPGCGGDWTITSWIIDGVDVVSTPVTFTAVGCGGDPARFHGAFAAALASLDPDAGWEPAYKDVCLWFVRAPSADPERVYGDLVLEGIRTDGTPYPGTPYTLTPGGTRDETRVTKVYARSCTGEITVSWLDEAGAPRDAPAGDLTPCTGSTAPQPCRNTATLLLCDTDPACEAGGEPTATDEPNPSQYPNWVLGNWCLVQTPGEGAPVWEGGSVVLGPDPACPTSGSGDTMRTIGVQLKAGSPTATAPVPLTVSLRVTNNGPNPGVVGDGRFGLWNAATGTRLTHVNVQNSAPVGHQQTLTLTANVPAAELAAGQIVAVLDVETYQGAGEKAWTVDQFEWSAEVPASECETQFLRTVVTDCETGETVSTTDTTLDGQPYTPTGEVGQCAAVGGECCPTPPEPQPCRDTSTLLVCDLPPGDSEGDASASDVSTQAANYPFDSDPIRCVNPLPGGGAGLWSGGAGSTVFPPETTASGTCDDRPIGQVLRGIAATLQAPAPDCHDGTVDVTVSARVTNDSPHPAGNNYNGSLRLHRADTGERLALSQSLISTPAATSRTLTATASGIDAALLAGGQLVAVLDVETFDGTNQAGTGNRWTADQFTATYAYGTDGCAVQFLRTVVTDCETGQVVSVTDATMDGQPYTPAGEVGPCQAAGGECCPPPEPAPDTEVVQLCDTVEGAAPVPFLRHLTYEPGSPTPVTVTDTEVDGTTPYTPMGAVGSCTPPCRDTSSTLLCDVASLDTVTVLDTVNRAGADGWQITSFTDGGCTGYNPPDGPIPGPAVWSDGYLSVRADRNLGTVCHGWSGYDTARLRWVLTKTFTAPEDGTAVITADAFRGDGGARVRVNGEDVGLYGQWNQPAAGGSTQVPVTAGPNVVEIEVRDSGGPGWVRGRLDVVMTRTTQFFRRQVTDCETGEVLSTTDTTLDGQPYTPTGEVGQCEPAGGECCPPPDPAPDAEVVQLCDRVEGADPVPFLRHFTYQPGAATPSTVTDTALDGVTPYTLAGEAGLCEDCPTSFNTECVAVIDRTEASYDNTSSIGGEPGRCGSVQGPADNTNPASSPLFQCGGGPYTITSWIVNGQEVIAEGSGGRTFNGGPCGVGTPSDPGMHQNWADALTMLDPTGATWIATQTDGCSWHVMSVDGTSTVYGTMVITGDGRVISNGTWTLGPAQDCEETQYTKVYTQECDGTVSVSWLDSSGVEVAAPEGEQVPCGTGCSDSGAGQGVDSEALLLCDVQPDGTSVPFLRHVTYGDGGAVASVLDTGLDGFTPYTPAGTVGTCAVEAEPCPARSVLEACRCDDTTGDGIGDTDYVELLGVDCDGQVTNLSTWTPDLSAPYTPVSPVECDTAGAEPPVMVQAHRVQLDPGGTWDAGSVPLLQSVTFTAHNGAGTVTTADGASTLFAGESVTWSLVRDEDTALVGPLSVMADTGTVTVAYTAVS